MKSVITLDMPGTTSMSSLREQLQERGIEPLDKHTVLIWKRNYANLTRVPGWYGFVCMVRSNEWYSLLAGMISFAFGIALVFSPIPAMTQFPRVTALAFYVLGVLGSLGVYIAYRRAQARKRRIKIRDAGAHWRTTKATYNSAYGGFVFQGNERGYSTVPDAGNDIIQKALEIPGAKVRIDYCSDDPFIKVTRGVGFWKESEIIFHWE